jgi:hypothetical protein
MQKPQQEHLILFATQHHWLHAYIYNSGTCQLTQTHCARFGDGVDSKHDWVLIESHAHYLGQPAIAASRETYLLRCQFSIVTREGRIQTWQLGKEMDQMELLEPWVIPKTVICSKTVLGVPVVAESEGGADWDIVQSHERELGEYSARLVAKQQSDVATGGDPIRSTRFDGSEDLDSYTRFFGGPISRILTSPDASLLAISIGCRVTLMVTETRERLCDYMCDGPVTNMIFNPTRYFIAIVYFGGFCMIDLEDTFVFKVKRATIGKRGLSVAFSSDGLIMMIGFDDNTIELYSVLELMA